jgi:hypothetical protein
MTGPGRWTASTTVSSGSAKIFRRDRAIRDAVG